MQTLVSVSAEGGSDSALDALDRAIPSVTRGIRRAIPFLARRRVEIVADKPSLVEFSALTESLALPVFEARLATDPGGNRAMLALDGPSIGFLLEGTFGGDGDDLPKLATEGLSAPQRAFIDRLCNTLARTFSDAMRSSMGMTLTRIPYVEGEGPVGPMVAVRLRFEAVSVPSEEEDEDEDEFLFADFDADDEEIPDRVIVGTLVVAVSKSALNAARAVNEHRPHRLNPRIADSLGEAEVELAAELGRMSMSLAEVLGLVPGDVLRLPVALGTPIELKVEDEPVFRALPTTVGTQLAVRIADESGAVAVELDAAPA